MKVRNCAKHYLFLMLVWIMLIGVQMPVYAAVQKIVLADNSGNYLEKVGKSWYLYDTDGQPLSGICYLKLKKSKPYATGFYYVRSNGKVCTGKHFHTVSGEANGKTFDGTYYFGGKNGRLYTKKGWTTIGGKKYYLNSYGKRAENCWKNGYYLQANGIIAKNKKTPDGKYVDCDGRKCSRNAMKLSSLKKTLKSTVSKYGGTWSIYVKNLETGDILNLNDQAMYPANTIKAFVMASTYNEIYHKRLSETSTVTSLLRSMITVSDNESYNELVRRQTSSRRFTSGCAVVNKYLKKNGYTATGCHSSLSPSYTGYVGDGGRNSSSAKDCAKLLEQIYKGKCVSKAYSKKMLNLLLQQTRRSKIPAGIPSGIKVANKTGETSSVQHDMAIVYGKKTDYVIAVFTSGCGSAYAGIKNVSRLVYNELN